MDSVLEQNRITWRSVLVAFLWLVIALGGLSLVVPLADSLLYALGSLILSGDPTGTVMDRYRLVSVRNLGLLAYGVAWLGGVIWLYTYFSRARTTGSLLRRFGVVAAIEAGIWGSTSQALFFM